MTGTAEPQTLLRVEELAVEFRGPHGPVRAVDRVSFTVGRAETVAMVGESGCGKSATALAVMGLVPPRSARAEGRVLFEGRDLLRLDRSALRAIRGAGIAMIFQEPMTSLNPVMRVGRQIAEALVAHRAMQRTVAERQATDLLDQVRLPDPARRARQYPHELSGGMRQRAMIAMAIACGPRLLIADEATTALDVSVQGEILDLLRTLRDSLGLAILLITHDFGVVAEVADRVVVLYAGRVVETAPVRRLFAAPLHPYTRALLGALPDLLTPAADLVEIPGAVPALEAMPPGCHFAPRCASADARCSLQSPLLVEHAPGHRAACWRIGDASQ